MPANPITTVTELNSPKSKSRKAAGPASHESRGARPILLAPQNDNVDMQPVAQKLPNHRRRLTVAEKSPKLVPAPAVDPVVAPVLASAPVRQALALLPTENEDSIITGMTRSLHRRLLGLNLPRISHPPQIQSQPAMLSLPDRRPAARNVPQARPSAVQPRIA